MPSRRSDRGNALKKQPGEESVLPRVATTALTFVPFAGLRGLAALPIIALAGGGREVDPEIQELTKTVMEAAAGKPLKVSITEQRRQQQIVESFISQFRERQLSEGQENSPQVSSQQIDSGESSSSSPSDASSKSDSNSITTDDLAGIQKSIEKLSSDLAQVSK